MNNQDNIDYFNSLDDETLNKYLFIENFWLLNDSTYAYLALDEQVPFPYANAVAEKLYDKDNAIGQVLLKLSTNSSEVCIRRALETIYKKYESNVFLRPDNQELIIDGALLENDQVIEFLRKCYDKGFIKYLSIIGEGYSLSEETYKKIDYFFTIHVDKSEQQHMNISINNPSYKIINGINSDLKLEEDIIINNINVTDNELKAIVYTINQFNSDEIKIDLRFENQSRVVEIINKLENFGLKEKIGIRILGYPLTENSDLYKELIPIAQKRKIEVRYACCHDLIGMYTKAPFLIDNSYKSELEPDGTTDLLTYIKILEFLEKFENKVEGIDSNIEKIMTAYKQLNDNYYYDADAGRNKTYGATRDIDKILDNNQIVCVGYANLLSIMCRRVGIPMFTYSAPSHKLNIARVIEKDSDGNILCDKICTFDATNDSGYEERDLDNEIVRKDNKDSYTYFGLDPERELHFRNQNYFLTIANILSIHPDDVFANISYSSSPISGSYSSMYSPTSYLYSLLHIMGYNYNESTDVFDVIGELQERDRIGEIPTELIITAARNIEKRNNKDLSDVDFNAHMWEVDRRIRNSIDKRNYWFDKFSPARINRNKASIIQGIEEDLTEVQTYSMGIPPHEYVDIDSIDMGPVYYQEENNNKQSDTPTDTNTSKYIKVDDILDTPTDTNTSKSIEVDDILDTPTNTNTPKDILIDDISEQPTGPNNSIPEPEIPEDPTNEVDSEPKTIDISDLIKGNGRIVIDGDVHIKGNVNIVINNYGQNPENLNDVTIAGTTIRKPKPKKNDETDDDYKNRIDNYYKDYLPNAINETNTTYHLTKNQIIQDLPINSLEEQIFNSPGMSDEEIENSRRMLL